jgi:hypothetical protein
MVWTSFDFNRSVNPQLVFSSQTGTLPRKAPVRQAWQQQVSSVCSDIAKEHALEEWDEARPGRAGQRPPRVVMLVILCRETL